MASSPAHTVLRDTGLGGLPRVLLKHKAGASAEVYNFGATLTSYKPTPEREVLFVSQKAVFDGKKAIRGGVPLVFPQFGQPKKEMAQHGFARSSNWELSDTAVTDDVVRAVFHLTDTEATRALWPFPFLLSYTLSLTARTLTTSLRIENKGESPFEAQALLHTYLRVADIKKVSLRGYHQHAFLDKVDMPKEGGALPVEGREVVEIGKETDRVYETGANEVSVMEGGEERVRVEYTASTVAKDGSDEPFPKPDCVLWNPWVDKSKAMADFGDEEWKEMVCVEPGMVKTFNVLPPGHAFVLEQTIRPV
jgi:glucose-6-phosphate 1-epimerase